MKSNNTTVVNSLIVFLLIFAIVFDISLVLDGDLPCLFIVGEPSYRV
jgi:hypothetical protein